MLADTDAFCCFARSGLRTSNLLPVGRRLLAVSVLACAMTVSGCARQSVTRDLHPGWQTDRASPAHVRGRAKAYPDQRRSADWRKRWPDAALLAPQQGPDCGFRGTNTDALDAVELARLKTEFERQCYQNAERATRERLNLLQAAVRHMRE
jgi:hypothetical protein